MGNTSIKQKSAPNDSTELSDWEYIEEEKLFNTEAPTATSDEEVGESETRSLAELYSPNNSIAWDYYFDVLTLAVGLNAMSEIGKSPIPQGLAIPYGQLFSILTNFEPTIAAKLMTDHKKDLEELAIHFISGISMLDEEQRIEIWHKMRIVHDAEIAAIKQLLMQDTQPWLKNLLQISDEQESIRLKERSFCEIFPFLHGEDQRKALSIYYSQLWLAAEHQQQGQECSRKLLHLNQLRLGHRKNLINSSRITPSSPGTDRTVSNSFNLSIGLLSAAVLSVPALYYLGLSHEPLQLASISILGLALYSAHLWPKKGAPDNLQDIQGNRESNWVERWLEDQCGHAPNLSRHSSY